MFIPFLRQIRRHDYKGCTVFSISYAPCRFRCVAKRKLISLTKLKTISTFCARFPPTFSGAWTMIFLINSLTIASVSSFIPTYLRIIAVKLSKSLLFCYPLLRLSDFPLPALHFLFRFSRALCVHHFFKRYDVTKEKDGHIKYPAPYYLLHYFFADKVSRTTSRIAFILCTAVMVL